MHKLIWYCCLGMVVVGGVVYLTHSGHKTEVKTLGRQSLPSLPMARQSGGHGEMASFGSCVQSEHPQSQENCPWQMPPQIIDVCQPVDHWSISIQHENELIPAGAEEPVSIQDAEVIGLPQEEEAEEVVMPRSVLPGDIEETEEVTPMPVIEGEEIAEPKTGDETNPILGFWMSFFKDVMPAAEEDGNQTDEPMDEVQEDPACQEDVHHPEHYPSCPYMGGCPRYSPPCPTGAGQEKKAHEEQCEPCPKTEADPESPAQPGVDTMEFRPSDAKDGEFEPKPM